MKLVEKLEMYRFIQRELNWKDEKIDDSQIQVRVHWPWIAEIGGVLDSEEKFKGAAP